MPGYDLSKLTEFPSAIIYTFNPESTHAELMGSQSVEDTALVKIPQYIDLLDAYLYAQDTILPTMKKAGIQALEAPQLKLWICGIHEQLGKTFLPLWGNVPSGKYAERTLLRFHTGGALVNPIILFLSGLADLKLDALADLVSEEYGVDKKEFKDFMLILLKLKADNTIKQTESQKRHTPKDQTAIGVITLDKLQTYYHSSSISAQEKLCIEKIVIVCMPCERLNAAMDEYCKKTVAKLKTIDKSKLDDVVAFIAETYHELVEIHPFPNCNGRTATCLINTLLRYLDLPSILFRKPGEKDDPNCAYSKIFAGTSVNMVLLKQHIKQRILEAQKEPFVDLVLKKVIDHRVAMVLIFQRIKTNHPEIDLTEMQNGIMAEADHNVIEGFAQQYKKEFALVKRDIRFDLQSIAATQYLMGKLLEREKDLDHRKANLIAPTPVNITQKLANISKTEISSWKFYPKQNAYMFKNEDKDAFDKVVELLTKAQTGWKMTVGTLDNKRYHVLQIHNLQPLKSWGFYAGAAPVAAATNAPAASAPKKAGDVRDVKHNDDGSVHKNP